MKIKVLAAAAFFALLAGTSSEAATIKLECFASSGGKAFCNYVKERFERETGNTLETVEFPTSSDERLSLFQQIFASKDGSVVDVFNIDIVWLGLLDKHLADLTDSFKDLEPKIFPAAWQNNVVNGRLKGIPELVDAGVMYYRTDLLEKYGEKPPATWEDMARIAKRIQDSEHAAGNTKINGFVFQGKAYEGLTCDALEWVAAYNGGTFVDADGKITINNPKAAKALDEAASWIGTIAPQGVLGYTEEEARAVFQNGDAVFMRNWPYAYLLTQDETSPVKGKVGIMPLPKGGEDGQNAATLGGWQWGVSNYSQNKDEAFKLVRILVSEEAQKKAFMLMGQSPTLMSLYSDPEILAKSPTLTQMKTVFDSAIARPSTPTKRQFPAVSKAIFNAAYDVLSKRADGTQAVADLEGKLKRLKGAEWK